MKLLFYLNTIGQGGAERVMVNLANNCACLEDDCVFVTTFPEGWEYSLLSNIKRVNLTKKRIDGFITRNFYLVKELRNVIKREKPDTVVSFMAEPNFRILLATIGMQCRKIISVRNDPDKEYPSIIFKILAKTLYCLADCVVFQTKDAKSWFPKFIQKKSCMIMNQVDDVFFNTSLAENRCNIVTTGRLVPQKNHKMLIEAFAKVSNEIEDNLYIYGEGELRVELELLVERLGLQNRVFLPGATKNVPEILSKAKAFVLSSDYEGMPNALLEAMAMGLPCISTDCPCGGPREILTDIGTEYLVSVGDADEMAAAIKKMCNLDSHRLDEISQNVKKHSQRYKGESVFKEWQQVTGYNNED